MPGALQITGAARLATLSAALLLQPHGHRKDNRGDRHPQPGLRGDHDTEDFLQCRSQNIPI